MMAADFALCVLSSGPGRLGNQDHWVNELPLSVG